MSQPGAISAERTSSARGATLKQRVLTAGAWNMAGYGLGQALRLASNLIMTRLLVPEMFGVMAIATMVTVILHLLSDIGVRQSIVQSRRGDDPVFLDTAWAMQIVRGAMMWLIALGLAAALYFANLRGLLPAGTVYASPVLPAVIALSSFASVIYGLQSTNWATAHRRFEQKRIMQIELAAQICALSLMIPLALATRSIWALVAGGLVSTLATTVLSHAWIGGHRNRFRWDPEAMRELVKFGKWIFVSSAIGVLATNGDRLLLGGLISAQALGLYAIATFIIGAISAAMTRLFALVSLPALSEIARSDPGRLKEIYYRLRVPGDLLLLFACGLLFATGQLVIDVLYDPRYSRAGEMLSVLSLSLFVVRYGVAHQIYLALGRPRNWAILNLVNFVAVYALVPSLFFAAGIHGAIWGIALYSIATLPFIYAFNARLGLNDWRRELAVLPALPAGFLCGLAVNYLRPWAEAMVRAH